MAALSADAVQKGRSVFGDKLGERVASKVLTVWDDGLAADGMATNPFDGEGIPRQNTPSLKPDDCSHSCTAATRPQSGTTVRIDGQRRPLFVSSNSECRCDQLDSSVR